MAGDWITGEELMQEYGLAAAEIGKACYDGTIHAFTADTLIPVIEESKIAHIPKYPPVGVNPKDHVQYTYAPRWNWDEYLRPSPEDIPEDTPQMEFLSWDKLGQEGSEKEKNKDASVWIDTSKINSDAYKAAFELLTRLKNNTFNIQSAALSLMETSFYYCDNTIDGDRKTLCFLFNMYRNWIHILEGKTKGTKLELSEGELTRRYKQDLAGCWYKRSEVDEWRGAGINSNPVSPINCPSELGCTSTNPTNDKEKNALGWLDYSRTVRAGKGDCEELGLALIAMHLWRDEHIHEKIYEMVYPNAPAKSAGAKKTKIARMVKKIPELAVKAGLPVPPPAPKGKKRKA